VFFVINLNPNFVTFSFAQFPLIQNKYIC